MTHYPVGCRYLAHYRYHIHLFAWLPGLVHCYHTRFGCSTLLPLMGGILLLIVQVAFERSGGDSLC